MIRVEALDFRYADGGFRLHVPDLVVERGAATALIGPSGSGKTTLLNALSARVPADEGSVCLNGENLYAHFDALKYNLAVVPQRDVLHDILPLNVALWYTAKMRLPADTDLSKPLAMQMSTALPSLDVAFADLGGASFKLAEGQLWFNDDAPLKWDATFVGRTTSLRPIVRRTTACRRSLPT